MCEDFAPKFGDKELVVPSQQRTVSHFLFHHGILTNNIMGVFPHPPYFSLFPQLKTKLKRRHFVTIEVIETESQAALNILTDHYSQDTFKNGRRTGNGAYEQKGTTSRVMVASRPEVSF
jgi:hypothetical protein